MSSSSDDDIIKKLNNSLILTKNIKSAKDDTYKYKLNDFDVKNFNKLIKSNTTRKRNIRNKYDCILESDLPYLTDLFNKIRLYFYGIPIVSDSLFTNGGVYVNCLPPNGHKTYKLYLFNYRCQKDKEYIDDIIHLLKSYGFSIYYD